MAWAIRAAIRLIGCVAAVLVPALPAAPVAAAQDAETLRRAVTELRAQYRIPGLLVIVVHDGDVQLVEAQGLTADTPMALGSTSKQFTGLIVQQLVARQRLALDATVGSLLPYAAGSGFADVTVAQLLAHHSGMGSRAGAEWQLWPAGSTIRSEAERLLALAPMRPPGQEYEYSNANYTLLGAIVEQITGGSYAAALDDLVARPLGLQRTTADRQQARTSGAAEGHYPWLGGIVATTPQPEWPLAAPSALITSTGSDLARVLLAQLGASSGISPVVLAATRQPLAVENEWTQYASGWEVHRFWQLTDENAGWQDPTLPTLFEHQGNTLRTFSYLGFSPERGLGVVILGDTSFGIDQAAQWYLTDRIVHAVVGTEPAPVEVDPLIVAGPMIMVLLPLAQAAALLWVLVGGRRPGSVWLRRLLTGLAIAVTATTALLVFWVVPGRSDQPVFDSSFLAAVPDLAISLWLSLALAGATIIALATRLFSRSTHRKGT